MNDIVTSKLYSHNLECVYKVIGDKVTTAVQLDNFCKKYLKKYYHGIYVYRKGNIDTEPWFPLQRNTFVIYNKPVNVHWVAIINKNDKLYEFDSYGRKNFVENGTGSSMVDLNTKNDKIPDQYGLQSDCGARCIAFVSAVFGKKFKLI